jgi:nicotinamide-nucleotide amidase
MIVEIITIGDEVVAGNILNTNTQYLADKLWQHGFEVEYHSSIRDDDDKITEVLKLAESRADLILIAGGLGPTADDFTIEVAARTFQKKLILDQDYLQYLEKLYQERGRELSENNKKQALVPKDGLIFKNKIGTAPGVALESNKKWFYFMAGVPVEMKHIFNDYVLPHILENRSDRFYFKTTLLRTFGIAESDLDRKLEDLYKDRTHIDGVRIGFRAHFPEILIKLSSWI